MYLCEAYLIYLCSPGPGISNLVIGGKSQVSDPGERHSGTASGHTQNVSVKVNVM